MAMVAYDSITILDLVDTATYIYYSENESGSGATTAPTATTKYIGIYSGPPVEGGQPSIPPTGTEWTKYVGEDGAPGEGVTVKEIKYEYAKSTDGQIPPTAGWEPTFPSLSGGDYLWSRTTTIYSDDDSEPAITYSVSYSGIDGSDANTYYIETNQEEILRFYEGDKYSYSPGLLTFKIYKNPKQAGSPQIDMSSENSLNSFKLEIQEEDGFKEIKQNENYLRLGIIEDSADDNNSNELVDLNTVYFNLNQYYENTEDLSQNSQIFRFSYLIEGKIAAIKIIQMRNGVSEDMAKLNLHASGIDAAIQNQKMSFSANGLALYENNEKVFWSEGGSLWLKGHLKAATGTFSGILEAAKGSFSGEVTANSGKIGGLTINEEGTLYSGSSLDDSNLKIYSNGEIYAQNITLGSGTAIKNFIELGEDENKVYIYTPTEENDYTFLKSGHISLHNQGLLKIGNITLNGGSGANGSEYITSSSTDSNAYWKICGDGTANFRELTVDKITVQNSVMEIGKIQAVGSVMFFRDSWKVKAVDGQVIELELTLKDKEGKFIVPLSAGDYLVKDGNEYYKITNVDKNAKITLDRKCNFLKGEVLTKIGKTEDYLITVQGDSNQQLYYSTPNSLTLSKIIVNENNENNPLEYSKKLVLGDLSTIKNAAGIGLFAENVYLKGTLSTEVDNNSYAGINTLNGATCTKFTNNDESKIVFWAGAKSNNEADIKEAPFQVTEKGSLYANQGLFEGSLITNSIIKGASIHTAKIYGENSKGKAALQIFDAEEGIQFIKTRDSEVTEGTENVQLGISSEGLYTGENIFIKLNQGIEYFGSQATYSNSNSTLFINPNSIGFDSVKDSNKPTWEIKMNSGFIFTNEEKSIFEINADLIKSTKKVNFEESLTFGVKDSQGALDYQKTKEGYYNLYVR